MLVTLQDIKNEGYIWVMEVEDEQEVSSFEHYEFIAIMRESNELVARIHPVEFTLKPIHSLVEGIQLGVFQPLIFTQLPLPSTEMITKPISLSGEVYPLRMAKLIPHKVEVSFSS